tara:strand:+ start:1282 stop:1512 length:231 start_codon:yes stop_codon:yes gene_type:complete
MNERRHIGQLSNGEEVQLGDMKLPEAAADRLAEMGLLPGATVRMIRRAPLGCPIEFEVAGARLALRQADAAQIFVQ